MRRPALILIALLAASTAGAQALPLERILLPPGFTIQVYASGLRFARCLAFSDTGTLFVGSKTGEVYAVPAGGEVGPDGALYVSDDEADAVYRIGFQR